MRYLRGLATAARDLDKVGQVLIRSSLKHSSEENLARTWSSRSCAQCGFLGVQHSDVQVCPINNERLGRLLMTASLVRAARNKMATVILEVDIENHRAIALYEQLEFKKRRGSISRVWTV